MEGANGAGCKKEWSSHQGCRMDKIEVEKWKIVVNGKRILSLL